MGNGRSPSPSPSGYPPVKQKVRLSSPPGGLVPSKYLPRGCCPRPGCWSSEISLHPPVSPWPLRKMLMLTNDRRLPRRGNSTMLQYPHHTCTGSGEHRYSGCHSRTIPQSPLLFPRLPCLPRTIPRHRCPPDHEGSKFVHKAGLGRPLQRPTSGNRTPPSGTEIIRG